MQHTTLRSGDGRDTRAHIVALFSALLAISSAASPGLAQSEGTSLNRTELLEILRNAPPAPNPPPPPALRSGAVDPSKAAAPVAYDPATAEEVAVPRSRPEAADAIAPSTPGKALTAPPQPGTLPEFDGGGTPPVIAPFAEQDIDAAATPPANWLALGGPPTPPAPIYGTLVTPWRTIAKLLMRFNVDGVDYHYVCSGSLIGSFHLLTAGHCIFNWDPNDDGNTADAQWAREVWAWPAQTDLLPPTGEPEWPYGEAKAALLRSYEGWTSSQAYAWDWGVVVLNRRDGDHTGWMGRETGVSASSLNYSGYPAETPYVPYNTVLQFHGFDVGNVLDYSGGRIRRASYVYGGHSGGPSWRYDSSSEGRWIQGVMSTSDRMGYAEDTLLNNGKFDDLAAWISEDESVRPPTPRPDLTEYVFAWDAKDLLDNWVRQGESVGAKFNVLNSGFAESGPVEVDFYLSPFAAISTSDLHIGSRMLGSLDAYMFTSPTTTLTIPPTVPPGSYYLGWIMRTAVAEYSIANNAAVIASETLEIAPALEPTPTHTATVSPTPTVTPAPCAGDCGYNGVVDVSELITLVNVNLGTMQVAACIAGDGNDDGFIVINEIVAAVSRALNGC